MAVLISDKFSEWQNECEKRFNMLKKHEEELNRCFISAYGLENEITPDIEEKDITIRKADLQREIKSLISYAVGCIFGRYSVDCDGLCFAGGEWHDELYKTIIPTKKNVLPIGMNHYKYDLTSQVISFIEKIYGSETLEENLKFIADALGGEGEPSKVIEKYLLLSFFSDHCKIYHKKPIYWLFTTSRKCGFKAIVYLHRWNEGTLSAVNECVAELADIYHNKIDDIQKKLSISKPEDRIALRRELNKFQEKYRGLLEYSSKIAAHELNGPEIELDDGVKSNYEKYSDVLERIK